MSPRTRLRYTVFRLLTDFFCLYNYEFWLSLYKIVRSSVILLLPLYTNKPIVFIDWISMIFSKLKQLVWFRKVNRILNIEACWFFFYLCELQWGKVVKKNLLTLLCNYYIKLNEYLDNMLDGYSTYLLILVNLCI